MKINGKVIALNAKLNGRVHCYDCWEFRYSALSSIEGNRLICINSYVFLPKDYHFLSIGYYDTIASFLKAVSHNEHIIYSCFFIPSNRKDSAEIIKDIMAMHPALHDDF